MFQEREFNTKEAVWAMVQGSPAWPAKIVKRLNVHGKIVYKVNFYNDPTYCYLHSHSLCPFEHSQSIELKELEENLKLKRAIELAKAEVYKNYNLQIIHMKESSSKTACSPIQTLAFQQTVINEENSIDLPQKNLQHQNLFPYLNNSETLNLDEITPSNVLQILESYNNGKMTQRIANLKRKQIITFQSELKLNLLLKFNLHSIDHLKQTRINEKVVLSPIEQLRAAKKAKKNQQAPKFQEKEQSMRKIQKLLFQKGMDRHMSYNITLKIVNEIEKRSQTMGKNASNYFKENIIRTLQQISSNMEQLKDLEIEYIEKNILSVLDLQFHQNKFEEGSRMTQIHEQFGV